MAAGWRGRDRRRKLHNVPKLSGTLPASYASLANLSTWCAPLPPLGASRLLLPPTRGTRPDPPGPRPTSPRPAQPPAGRELQDNPRLHGTLPLPRRLRVVDATRCGVNDTQQAPASLTHAFLAGSPLGLSGAGLAARLRRAKGLRTLRASTSDLAANWSQNIWQGAPRVSVPTACTSTDRRNCTVRLQPLDVQGVPMRTGGERGLSATFSTASGSRGAQRTAQPVFAFGPDGGVH